MGSGKRASMREGPLAALFRKTETDGVDAPPPGDWQMPQGSSNECRAGPVLKGRAGTQALPP